MIFSPQRIPLTSCLLHRGITLSQKFPPKREILLSSLSERVLILPPLKRVKIIEEEKKVENSAYVKDKKSRIFVIYPCKLCPGIQVEAHAWFSLISREHFSFSFFFMLSSPSSRICAGSRAISMYFGM